MTLLGYSEILVLEMINLIYCLLPSLSVFICFFLAPQCKASDNTLDKESLHCPLLDVRNPPASSFMAESGLYFFLGSAGTDFMNFN